MKKIIEKVKRFYNENDKKAFIVFVLLRILVIICLIRELINGNFESVLFCILTLFLFIVPYISEKIFKIDFPSCLEIIVLIFIFSAEILGEINNFYGTVPFWDNALHTVNGFLCGSIGFSLIYLLNQKTKFMKLSPVFVALFSFCFSMTVGIVWEMFEYGMDVFFLTDMQKDTVIDTVATVGLRSDGGMTVLRDISAVTVNGQLLSVDGYLDIGLHDTMKDLIVNFIGASVFSIIGYFYVKRKGKGRFAARFIPRVHRKQDNQTKDE